MQKRKHSLMETILSTAIGFWIAVLTQSIVFPWFGIQVTISTDLVIAVIFTVVSIIRGYFVRRLFNYFHVKGILK